ncbi:MAG: hypothetical protein WC323_02850 [Patescibacteria group bacterium]|jgi:hypothetical protein
MDLKEFFNYFILKLAKYHLFFSVVSTSLIMLVSLIFIFKLFFVPMNDIYDIYKLSSEINNYPSIDAKKVDSAYESLNKKINRERIPVDDIIFP